MRKWFVRLGSALMVLALIVLVALMTWEPFAARMSEAPNTGRTYTAEIIRDEFGVPHIYGKTDPDVSYGIAIAQSEDDFFTLQDVMAMTKGRYGAIAGPDGAQVDFAYHLIDARGVAEKNYDALPETTRALFEAYAAGLNDYAAAHPEELKLANLFPINGEDVVAGFSLRLPFFYGMGSIIGNLVEGKPLRREFGPDIPGFPRDPIGKAASAKTALGRRTETRLALPQDEMAALSGSNAFAVAPAKSAGPTTLVSNSHQPWRGGAAWYELVVESEEGWHFAGVNLPGTPYPVMGHNEELGWTYTVNRPDLVDIFKLELDESGTRYRLDDEWRVLEEETATLPVKMGPVVLPIQQTFYRSIHGPVIKNDNGAFALRYANMDSVGLADAFYRLGRAQSLDDWLAVYEKMEIPNFNAVYADAKGNIAYLYNAAFPDRKPGHNWRSVLPGDDSSLIWDKAVDFERLPKIINPSSGWLYNANNEPFTAAGAADDLDPADFAPELGVELKQTNRSRRAWKLLSEANILDRDALERIKYDRAYEREGYVADLWDDLEELEPTDPALGKARQLLLDWDFTADGKGAGDALALLMIKDFMSAEYQNKDLPDVAERLQWSRDHLMEHFGRLDPPMGELLRLRQGPTGPFAVDLPLDGGSDTLRASTTWQVDPDGRLQVVHGDSFIMWVEWLQGERVSSRSIQPFGAAVTRPASPHFTDQSALFVRKELKPVHFWRVDAEKNAKTRKTVTSAR